MYVYIYRERDVFETISALRFGEVIATLEYR